MCLEKDGSLEIKTSHIPYGIGYPDIWRNMAQEILGVEGEFVRLTNNTQDAPDSGVATLSRNISLVTRLIEKCCTAIRNQRFRHPLPITVKRSAKSVKEPGWTVKNIESEAFARPSWGAAVAEIEIDPISLSPIIRGIWLVVDGGKILSEVRARSTLRTGIIQALGWTCREQVFYKEGEIPIELYQSYDIIAPLKVPPIHVDFIRNDTAPPKGIGDLPFCCIPAAFVQAVSQAMDHHFEKIPLEVRDIWEAVNQKQKESTT
jgi:CO/xanthine dehydrogenase Mo-binding subunit